MPFPAGPVWTDPRPNAPAHTSDELFPLLPKLPPTILTIEDAVDVILDGSITIELDVCHDTDRHEIAGLRELWWPDWAVVLTYVQDQAQYSNTMRRLKEKYLGGSGSQASPDQISYAAWSRDNPRLARSLCGQVLLLLILEAPAGTIFRQDPSDSLTWGFFSP